MESISTGEVVKSGVPDDVTTESPDINTGDQNNSSQGEVTMGQKNALDKALSYLEFTSFSYNGLIEQLEFDQFSHEDAVYAADNCGADWNEQAGKKAKSYLEFMSFSRDGLIEQLEFDGFTPDQAEYGVSAVGY